MQIVKQIPGVKILRPERQKATPANMIPASIGKEEVTWARLGRDEQYNVTLNRKTWKIEVIEVTWNEEDQDWNDSTVQDPSNLDLTVYLP